ncbi:MAG: transcription termination/antitermination protein NusG [Alphaproteobacteria bacterium]
MADQFSDREWFSVVSKPGQQRVAAEQLERQGYRAFLPMCLRERNNGPGRIETVARPLFDRYVFVGIHTEQAFRPIWSTIGVQFVVCGSGHIPVRVPAMALRRVAKRLEEGGGMIDLRPSRAACGPMVDWEAGDALQVIEGPFRDFAATLVEWADKRREIARVMVEIFGRVTPVEMPTSGLKPVGKARAA